MAITEKPPSPLVPPRNQGARSVTGCAAHAPTACQLARTRTPRARSPHAHPRRVRSPHALKACLHEQLLCVFEAVVIIDQIDRPDLQHVAELYDCLAHREIGHVLDDRVLGPQVAVVLEQAVGGAERAGASVVLKRKQSSWHLEYASGGSGSGGYMAAWRL